MAKKGTYQRKKERKDKILGICGILLIAMVFLLSAVELVRCGMILNTWDSGGILEFRSEYTLHRVDRHKSPDRYVFTWDDGSGSSVLVRDTQHIDRLLLAQDAGNPEKLIVRYTRLPALLSGDDARRPVSIVSATDGTVYYEQTKADFRMDMVLCALLMLLMLILLLPIGFVFLYLPMRERRKKAEKKHDRERRNAEKADRPVPQKRN